MSNTALAPADTTSTGAWLSSVKSCEISKESWALICTPPIPPVAKTLKLDRPAIRRVADTVVAAMRAELAKA